MCFYRSAILSKILIKLESAIPTYLTNLKKKDKQIIPLSLFSDLSFTLYVLVFQNYILLNLKNRVGFSLHSCIFKS